MKKYFKVFIISIVLLITAILASRIYLFKPASELIGDFGDKYEFFTFQYLVRQNILSGKFPLAYSDTLRYPVGFEFGHGYDGVLSTFVGAFLGMIIPPILAYNLTIVFLIFLNLVCAYILFQYISKSFLIAYVSSIIYGLSPYVLSKVNGHPNLLFIGGFPLLVYFALKISKKTQSGSKIGITELFGFLGSILAVSFGSLQYIIMLFAGGILFLLLSYFLVPISETNRFFKKFIRFLKVFISTKKRELFIAIALFIIIVLFFFGKYISGVLSGSFVYGFDYNHYNSCCIPKLTDLFIPNQFLHPLWGRINLSSPSIEKVVSMGLVEWVLFIFLVLTIKDKTARRLLLIALFLYIDVALNIFRVPYFPEGGRTVILFTLLFLFYFVQSKLVKNNLILFLVLSFLFLERIPTTVYHTGKLISERESKIISQLPGKAVMDIPLSKYNPSHSYLSFLYNKKIVDGYFHDTAENNKASSFLESEFIQRYICDGEKQVKDAPFDFPTHLTDTVDLLRNLDIKTVVIHKNKFSDKFLFGDCKNVRYWWYSISPDEYVFSENTEGKITIKVPYNPRLKARLFFAKGGIFILKGLNIVPYNYYDVTIRDPKGNEFSPEWIQENGGIKTPVETDEIYTVKPGEMIDIVSDKEITSTAYVNVYFSFQPDEGSFLVNPPIEKLYTSDTIEIYKIN